MARDDRDKRGADQQLFEELIERAKRGSNIHFRSAPQTVTLQSAEAPAPEEFTGYAALMQHARQLGVDLSIVGGGDGCFQVVLGDKEPVGNNVLALLEDKRFQDLATEANLVQVSALATNGKQITIQRHYDLPCLIATDRKPGELDAEDYEKWFGTEPAETLSYGAIAFKLRPHAFKNGKAKNSSWTRVFGLSRINMEAPAIEWAKYEPLTKQQFLSYASKRGHLMHVHGFATDFADAAVGSVTFFQNLDVASLELVPIIYSWPSEGKKFRYDRDSRAAVESSYFFRDFVSDLSRINAAVSIVAHSHGNSLLFSALSHIDATKISNACLRHGILCAPDVDKTRFTKDAHTVRRVFRTASVYFSKNDVALWISGNKFAAKRAGKTPIALDNWDVVDASNASTGIDGHSYYATAKNVLNDVRDILLEIPVDQRILQRRLSKTPTPGVYLLEM